MMTDEERDELARHVQRTTPADATLAAMFAETAQALGALPATARELLEALNGDVMNTVYTLHACYDEAAARFVEGEVARMEDELINGSPESRRFRSKGLLG